MPTERERWERLLEDFEEDKTDIENDLVKEHNALLKKLEKAEAKKEKRKSSGWAVASSILEWSPLIMLGYVAFNVFKKSRA